MNRGLVTVALLVMVCTPQAGAELRDGPPLSHKRTPVTPHPARSAVQDAMKNAGSASEGGAMAGMTAAHNKARAAVGQGLPPLTWDPQIAAFATDWAKNLAKTCQLKHHSSPYGENIAAGLVPNYDQAPEVFSLWMEEKAHFDQKNGCAIGKTCGHYTQIVWKATTRLGCGYAACAKGAQYDSIWVCNYSPPGNFSGQKPY